MQDSHFDDIKNLLRQMQTEEVSAAEARLTEYSKQPGFLEALVAIMRNPSDQQWLKTVAASSLNNTLTNYAEEQTAEVSLVLKKVLMDPSIKSLDKRCMERSLVKTINCADYDILCNMLIGKFSNQAYILIQPIHNCYIQHTLQLVYQIILAIFLEESDLFLHYQDQQYLKMKNMVTQNKGLSWRIKASLIDLSYLPLNYSAKNHNIQIALQDTKKTYGQQYENSSCEVKGISCPIVPLFQLENRRALLMDGNSQGSYQVLQLHMKSKICIYFVFIFLLIKKPQLYNKASLNYNYSKLNEETSNQIENQLYNHIDLKAITFLASSKYVCNSGERH